MAPSKPKSGFAALMDDSGDNEDIEVSKEIEERVEPPKKDKQKKKKEKIVATSYSDDEDANVVKPEDYPDSDNEKVPTSL